MMTDEKKTSKNSTKGSKVAPTKTEKAAAEGDDAISWETLKTEPKRAADEADEPKKGLDTKVVIGIAAVLVIVVAAIIAILAMCSKTNDYEVLIDGVENVQCEDAKGSDQIICTGEVSIPARLNAEAATTAMELGVVATGGDLASGAGKLPSTKIKATDYEKLKDAQSFEEVFPKVVTLRRKNQKNVVYNLNVKYTLSDADRQLLAGLDEAYQKEQEAARQEAEQRRQEAERLEAERKKEQALAEQKKQNQQKMQTTAHIVCKRYIEKYFFPLSVKIHSIMGVGYDKAMTDYTWGYGVNVTVSSAAGGQLKYMVACVAGNFSSNYESASVIDFAVQDGWK